MIDQQWPAWGDIVKELETDSGRTSAGFDPSRLFSPLSLPDLATLPAGATVWERVPHHYMPRREQFLPRTLADADLTSEGFARIRVQHADGTYSEHLLWQAGQFYQFIPAE